MSDHLEKDGILAALQSAHPVIAGAGVGGHLAAEVDKCEDKVERALYADDPYAKHRRVFQKAQASLQQEEFGRDSVGQDLAQFRQLAKAKGVAVPDSAFWEKRIGELWPAEKENKQSPKKELADEQKAFRAVLQKEWGRVLDEAQAKWRLETIEKFRQKLLKQLAEWLELLQILADSLRDFAFEPGVLFDLSKGQLTPSDIAEMQKWAKYLRTDKEMRRLCELLGRMRRTAQSKRREWIETMEKFTEVRPDINSREEFSGIRLGNSIEHALPQEKALLADPDTALLFDLKFVERRLLEFDTAGWVRHEQDRAKKVEVEVTEEEKKGALIVCVDTSASMQDMQGTPANIAKAVTLYLATEAQRQKRNCYLINFSTDTEEMDLSTPGSFRELIKFLKMSFNGGTDIAPALRRAVQTMKTKNYKNADLLAVSDFVMGRLDADVPPLIDDAKKSGARFFSLAICDDSAAQKAPDFFNRDWRYTPGKGAEELHKIAEELDKETRRPPPKKSAPADTPAEGGQEGGG